MGKTKLFSVLKSFLDCLCLCLSRSRRRGRGRDSEDGHLLYNTGDLLRDRYEIVNMLGEGTFGKVLQCVDHGRGGLQTAVKVIKSQEKFREAAKLEIKVLEKIRESDPLNQHHCVQMLCWFNCSGHVCICFELLSLSTFDFLKANSFVPYPLHHIRHMAYQICDAVSFLHDNKLTHTDLKPENVLFVSSDYDTVYNLAQKRHERRVKDSTVQLVDFGSATFDHEHHSAVVSTRHYRAPEVILDLGWTHQCDVWSIGCVLFEYYKGCTLYQTHENREHLGMMEKILGPLPHKMLHKSRKLGYVRHGPPDWRDGCKTGRNGKDKCKPLRSYLQGSGPEHGQFFDLLEAMLQYEPSKRISLSSALKHPFLLPLRPLAANQEWRSTRDVK